MLSCGRLDVPFVLGTRAACAAWEAECDLRCVHGGRTAKQLLCNPECGSCVKQVEHRRRALDLASERAFPILVLHPRSCPQPQVCVDGSQRLLHEHSANQSWQMEEAVLRKLAPLCRTEGVCGRRPRRERRGCRRRERRGCALAADHPHCKGASCLRGRRRSSEGGGAIFRWRWPKREEERATALFVPHALETDLAAPRCRQKREARPRALATLEVHLPSAGSDSEVSILTSGVRRGKQHGTMRPLHAERW